MNKISRTILYMQQEGIIPSEGQFDVTEEILSKYREIFNLFSRSLGEGCVQPKLGRKLAGLSLIKYKKSIGGTSTSIKEGLIYIITNKAWPHHFKMGMTIDLDERIKSYQTYSPFRDYKIEKYALVLDRKLAEKQLLSLLPEYLNEWANVEDKHIIANFLNKFNK